MSRICHIKAARPGGPRFDPCQSDAERHAYDNLVLMCVEHADRIDTDPTAYPVELLQVWKSRRSSVGVAEISKRDSDAAATLLREYEVRSIKAGGHVAVNSPGAIQATNITIKTPKSTLKFSAHPDSIGASLPQANYLQHLICRYNDFARTSRNNFSRGVIYRAIQREFKATWRNVPVERFDELVSFLQRKIDGTRVGRINRGKGIPNYSPFASSRQFGHVD